MRTRAGVGVLIGIALVMAVVDGTRAQSEDPPPQFTTRVHGTAPADVDGRWVVLAHLSLPGERVVNVVSLLDVKLAAPEPSVTKLFVQMPEALQQAFEAANQESQAWNPTPDDIAAIAAAWEELPPSNEGVALVETDVFAHEAFDDTISTNAGMKDARWAIRQKQSYRPGASRPVNQVSVIAITADRPDGWSGPYATVTVAAAPFPIPIAFSGTVDVHRLADGAGRGFLARIFDVFSGCGR
jgi:hypothetical protein